MPFLRIDNALNTSTVHVSGLDPSDPASAEIEAYVVAGLVVLIVSEYENLIEQLFVERAAQAADAHLASYVKAMMHQRFRSPDLGKITEALGRFGSDYKKAFGDVVLNTEAHAAWDNIMTARHAVVHKQGSLNLTVRELALTFPKTKTVLDQLRATLGVP